MINIDIEKCNGCGLCVTDCPAQSIRLKDGKAYPGGMCLECGHCAALCAPKAVSLPGDYDPSEILEYDDPKQFEIEPNRLLNFVKYRRSVRQFTDEAVSDADIAKIIEMGRYTQTGANMQWLRYIVLTKDTLREIAPIALRTLAELDVSKVDQKALRVPHPYLQFQPVWVKWHEVYQKKGRDLLFFNAPNALLVVSQTGNDLDGALNAGHMELMINALGLGACFMGFGTLAFDMSNELKQRVGIQPGESVILMMIFGHPKIKYLRTVNRKKARYEKI